MKSFYVLWALALVTPAFSQNGAVPEVLPGGRVTFRLKAPKALEVRVECESLPGANMVKDDQGVWTFTTTPLEPDYYSYTFLIDGVRSLDMSNPLIKYNLLSSESLAHVPGPASLPWELNDVPHGILHRHFYHSAAAGDDRAYFVYTPPNYQPSARTRYPVLYLLHGASDDASGWGTFGLANVMLDNLIARGQAKPMLVVMPLSYGTLDVVYRGPRSREPGFAQRNASQFRASLLDEVLPQVEFDYRVSKDRKARAIAGLSPGAAQSLTIGLNNLDRFAWIGSFSCAGLSTNFSATFPALDAKAGQRLRLLWISCGKDDRLLAPNTELVHWLKAREVNCDWREVPGGHSWRVWRRNLADFASLLFR
jgi:enterochelin esterase-like enzyme